MDPSSIAAQRALAPPAAAQKLSEVTLVAAGCECLPKASEWWPVRTVASKPDGRIDLKNTYLCGRVSDVLQLLGRMDETPLAILVDQAPSDTDLPFAVNVQIIPVLQISGLEGMKAWEAVVCEVCSRHVETIQGMIFEHAQRTPDKEALIFEDRIWTYREVVSMACSVSSELRIRGITPEGGIVAVQGCASDFLVIVYLGLYSASFLFQIVDSHPESQAYRLEACPCQAIIVERGLRLPEGIRHVFMDDLQLDSTRPLHELCVGGNISDPLYIEYTSGSTGKPKSVITWQWRLAHWTRWRHFHFPFKPDDDREGRNLFFIWYWHITMCQGGTTVVYPTHMNYDVSGLMQYARKHSITRFDCLTPGLILALLEVEDSLPESLKVMISGGEALATSTCRTWLRKWPHCHLWNNFAATEASADVAFCRITPEVAEMDVLYAPISDGCIAWQNEVKTVDGIMVIQGWNVCPGYLNPAVSDKFEPSPCGRQNVYLSGDRISWAGGYCCIQGRVDSVVKVRGYNVDLAGLEAILAGCSNVKDAACVAWRDTVCSLVVTEDMMAVKQFADEKYPLAHLIVWYKSSELPYTKSGKRNRPEALKMLEAGASEFTVWSNVAGPAGESLLGGQPKTEKECLVAAVWKAVLGRDVGREEPFQNAGGHSLAAMRIAKRLGMQPAEVFAFPTIALMAAKLERVETGDAIPTELAPRVAGDLSAKIGIVGMAGRFPGASSVEKLWQALEAGTDLISDVPAGPQYIPRKGTVPDLGLDCSFWGIPAEAARTMDTTQRALLETAYEALEDAGLDPFHVSGRVGVVVSGGSVSHYVSEMLGINIDECRTERPDEYFALEIGTDKDYLATQIAYRLNLHGPAEIVQTACSSSLVAIVRAVQLLRLRICDYVICGGASFSPDGPVKKVDGMIWSPDGICRPFADDANGTVNSDGCGLVVLTRLDDAQQKGERVYATVLGAASNNDGARKAGFSAPSFEGQVEVLRAARADAGVRNDEIDYIEAHGTGTRLGDPLEIHALSETLPLDREILLGSVKGNIGHLNTAAGIPGFMKAALMLHHQRMVPSIHSDKPNHLIDWNKTPLRLATAAQDWQGKVAGVSSFGIGGTNAHVVLGAPPVEAVEEPERSIHVFTASAKSQTALEDQCLHLSTAIRMEEDFLDAETTLLARPKFVHRAFALRPEDLPKAPKISNRRPVILLFPGQGGAYSEMGAYLEKEGLLSCKCDGSAPVDIVKASLAVAETLQDQGLVVDAVLGHSVGEWAAAAFAGAFSKKDCLDLAMLRGNLMSTMDSGIMVSARATVSQVEDLVKGGIEMACVNGAETVVLAGPADAMLECMAELEKRGITSKKLQTKHAFHTAAVDPILPAYTEALRSVQYSGTRLPILSNVTGEWYGPDATSPEYWQKHLRQTVRFHDNLKRLAQRFPVAVVVEVGPSVLAGVVAREAASLGADWKVVPTMRERDELATYMRCLGTLWTHADLQLKLPKVAKPTRLPLPSYPFERKALVDKRHVANNGDRKSLQSSTQAPAKSQDAVGEMLYETALESVECSCLHTEEATIVLDGDLLPKGLPKRTVQATYDRAVVAAQASGYLLFIGTSISFPTADDTSQEQLLKNVVSLLRSLTKAKAKIEVFFFLRANLRYASVKGLLRSAAREHPELRLRCLEIHDDAKLILPTLAGEYVLKVDGAYVRRLRAAPISRSLDEPHAYKRALVTGGLRGLGVKVAEWLVASKRAASLVLMGRNHPKGEAADIVQKLQSEVHVDICIGDVSQWADVRNLPDCDLVVHMAGNVKDGLLLHASEDDMQRVLRPKIRGAVHLKNHLPKARMLGFSSSSGVFGTAGQASYSAANTFLDAIMPTVQWGGWGEVGMALDLDISPTDGERFFPVSEGLDCIGRVLDTPERAAPVMALDVDWHLYRHNKDAFSLDDPLLANMDGRSQPLSILGTPQVQLESFAWTWELVTGPEGSRFRGSCPAWDVCRQHVVGNTMIFPGTAFVALALEAARQVGVPEATLSNIAFLRPLELMAPRRLMTGLVQNDDGSKSGSIRFSSQPIRLDGHDEVDDSAPAIVHCTCTFSGVSKARTKQITVSDMCQSTTLYERFEAAGFNYGPAFRASEVEISTSEATARCKFITHSKAFFQLHPAALDTAMHLVALLHPSGLNGVPHKLRQFQVFTQTHPVEARAVLDGAELELQLLDDVGDVVCNIKGLELAPLDVPPALHLRARAWRELPQDQVRGLWLLNGQEAAALDLPRVTKSRSDLYDAEVFAVTATTLEDVHRCAEKARTLSARTACWVVAVEAPFAEAAAAAAVEMGAHAVVGAIEDVRKVSSCLSMESPPIVYASKEAKLLVEHSEEIPAVEARVSSPSDPFVVEVDPSKGAKGAKCHGSQRRPPAAHEVEVKASIWALNFRDVLVAVGAIPADVAGQKLGIGGECYGEVVKIGENVTNLKVGDRVVAVPPDGMGSFATIDSQWVGIAPPAMTSEEAVSGTAVYATAWLGLHWLARISEGDRVLIHSAAGGVGLAAINLCLRAGCTVYATASTQEKRELLLSMGVAGAFDSRNVADFVDGVQSMTKGEGVDVVLNSLSGEAIEASMRLLSPFGRFIEIGKRDQYEDTKIGLSPFLNGIMYAAAHLDVLMLRHPKRCRKLLEEVWAVMPALPKLPFTTFKMTDLDKALEYFSKGVHVGKLLISIGEETPVYATHPSMVSGLAGDAVTQAIQEKLGAAEGKGGIVCIRNLPGLTDASVLDGAQMVLTTSRAVADIAYSKDPNTLSVILPQWEPIANIQEWFGLKGRFLASEEEKEGNLEEWLMEVVHEMAGSVSMDQTFESVGLDSLALISLARRLSAKIGKAVSVVDLYDHPTPQQLLASLSGGPQAQISLPKVVCLHGFRTNREIMSFACAPLVSAVGLVEWVFINAPRHASGPTDPKITLDMDTYEWWGQKDGCYETGWMAPHFDGLEDTLPVVKSLAPAGIVGFSQGAAMAALLECKWLALFSAVVPPGIQNRETPSFHSYDLSEDFVAQCVEVASHFSNKEVHTHSFGHAIPQDDASTKAFASFVAAHL